MTELKHYWTCNRKGTILFIREDMMADYMPKFDKEMDAYILSCYIREGWMIWQTIRLMVVLF